MKYKFVIICLNLRNRGERYEKDLQELLNKKEIEEELKDWAKRDFLKYSEIEYMLKIIL